MEFIRRPLSTVSRVLVSLHKFLLLQAVYIGSLLVIHAHRGDELPPAKYAERFRKIIK